MNKNRFEFFVLTVTIFLVGVVLYGIVGLVTMHSNAAVESRNSVLYCIFMALGGGYFFFSILSGVLFTVRWASQKSLKEKMLLTVFFVVPLWLAMAGVFYSIPYGIYNFVQYKKSCLLNSNDE